MYNRTWTDGEIIRELRAEQLVCETMKSLATKTKNSSMFEKYESRWMELEGMIYELSM